MLENNGKAALNVNMPYSIFSPKLAPLSSESSALLHHTAYGLCEACHIFHNSLFITIKFYFAGHFAAFEEPEKYSSEIVAFTQTLLQ